MKRKPNQEDLKELKNVQLVLTNVQTLWRTRIFLVEDVSGDILKKMGITIEQLTNFSFLSRNDLNTNFKKGTIFFKLEIKLIQILSLVLPMITTSFLLK